MSRLSRPQRWWHAADRAGATASLLCAVHCAVLPFVLAVLPLLGLGFLAGHAFERGFILFAAVLAAVVLAGGWRRHRRRVPVALAVPGLLLLIAGACVDLTAAAALHTWLVIPGGVLVACGHMANLHFSHRCGSHHAVACKQPLRTTP